MEFLKPIQGFFCGLCHQFSGDGEEAEFHMLSEEHNCKFEVKSPKCLRFMLYCKLENAEMNCSEKLGKRGTSS